MILSHLQLAQVAPKVVDYEGTGRSLLELGQLAGPDPHVLPGVEHVALVPLEHRKICF